MSFHTRRLTKSGASGVFTDGGTDRFDPLLLAEGEYWFRDHSCNLWTPQRRRIPSQLKVCSQALYIVPRDEAEAILRIPLAAIDSLTELEGESTPTGEDLLAVSAGEHTRMQVGGRDAPYQRVRARARFDLSLVYVSTEEALPLLRELLALESRARGGDAAAARAAGAGLRDLIAAHEAGLPFNLGWLEEDGEEVAAEALAAAVTPLVETRGRVVVTQARLYFQPFNLAAQAPVQSHRLDRVTDVQRRAYRLADLGLELFLSGRESLYLAFDDPPSRARFQAALERQPALRPLRPRSLRRWQREWVAGRVSNFDYLMHLNREAGRSFNDLTQYPIFPWVLADYTSRELDLDDPAVFRDLAKPVGALNPARLADFTERHRELKKMTQPGTDSKGNPLPGLDMPPFMYGCHYSSPGYVVFYLLRADPKLMLRLQNGRFDAPDRLFWSVADSWKSVLTLPTDVKELTPEFYSNDPTFLVGREGQTFGKRANGQEVGPVVLPPWARDGQDFLHKMAQALESRRVSARLHKWINLVFGYKSRGQRAEEADNVFHYLTYDEIAERFLAREENDTLAAGLRMQMMEFGRTPRQLFHQRHPCRRLGGTPALLRCLCLARPPPPVLPTAPAAGRAPWLRGGSTRHLPPAPRAVFRLAARHGTVRDASLEWLEGTARTREPALLSLRATAGAELTVLVRGAREAEEAGGAGEDAATLERALRALRALAVAPANHGYILDSGGAELAARALARAAAPGDDGGAAERRAAAALETLAALALGGAPPRAAALEPAALLRAAGFLASPARGVPAAAATAVASAARASPAARAFFLASTAALPRLVALVEAAADEGGLSPAASPAAPTHGTPRTPGAAHAATGEVGARSARADAARRASDALAALLRDDVHAPAALRGDALRALDALCALGSAGGVAPATAAAALEALGVLATLHTLRTAAARRGVLGLLAARAAGAPAGGPVLRAAAAALAAACTEPELLSLGPRGAERGGGGVEEGKEGGERGAGGVEERGERGGESAEQWRGREEPAQAADGRRGRPQLVEEGGTLSGDALEEPAVRTDHDVASGAGGGAMGGTVDAGGMGAARGVADGLVPAPQSSTLPAPDGDAPPPGPPPPSETLDPGLAVSLARAVAAAAAAPDPEVQRHAAAALWHLAVRPAARRGLLRAAEGVAARALVALAAPPRPSRARDLARAALRACLPDAEVRPALEREAARAGRGAQAVLRGLEGEAGGGRGVEGAEPRSGSWTGAGPAQRQLAGVPDPGPDGVPVPGV
ncbi:hypothetical protein ACKKBG_A12960 [Auxenochlorella protothecoides x Auxenochlorella symbiontica]